MANIVHTNSLSFPNMFDVARNRVGVLEDDISIVNRGRLLILTEPTELYNSPDFGVGLKRYLWEYNTDNQRAIIKDRIVAQLGKYEPYIIPEETQTADGLLFSETGISPKQQYNTTKLTVAVKTVYQSTVDIGLNTEG